MDTNKLYRFHYTTTYFPNEKIHKYQFVKFNNVVEFVSPSGLHRGDLVRITDIDYTNSKIFLEKVQDDEGTYPVLICVNNTVPFDDQCSLVPEFNNSYEIIYSKSTTYNGNGFYTLVAGISKFPTTIDLSCKDKSDRIMYYCRFDINYEEDHKEF